MGASEIQIPITLLLVKELNFKGSFRYGVSVSFLHVYEATPMTSSIYSPATTPLPLPWYLKAKSISSLSSRTGTTNHSPLCSFWLNIVHRFEFSSAKEAFETTKAGKSPDGKPVIKAVISGPGVSPNDV